MSAQHEHPLRNIADITELPLAHVAPEFGTPGLEHRLQLALGSVGLRDNDLIQASTVLGLELHQHDRRTYEPYNNHLLRVALRLIEELGIVDPETIAAAPVHDGIEDHPQLLVVRYLDRIPPADPRTLHALGREALGVFASRHEADSLADIVFDVSTPPAHSRETKQAEYIDFVTKLMTEGDARSRALKTADFLDNTDLSSGLEKTSKRRYLDRKQILLYRAVIRAMEQDDSLIVGEARDTTTDLLLRRRAATVNRLGYDPEN